MVYIWILWVPKRQNPQLKHHFFPRRQGGLASMQLCIFGIGDRQQAMLEPLYLGFCFDFLGEKTVRLELGTEPNGREFERFVFVSNVFCCSLDEATYNIP